MDEHDWLAERFEAHRAQLRAVAYRMLGSLSAADDAVQDAWLRLSGADISGVENLGGWLTTVVARVCLNMLQSRQAGREEPMDGHVPGPLVSREEGTDPEHEALLADSGGDGAAYTLVKLGRKTSRAKMCRPIRRWAGPVHDTGPLRVRSMPVLGGLYRASHRTS